MRRLRETSESGYATRVKQLTISTHLLQDRTFRSSFEEDRQYRDLCKEERQAIGYVYSQVHHILKHCLPSVEVIVIADYEDTWTCAKTGFITGGPMGRKEILLRTGVDIVETHTLQPTKIVEHWRKRRSILAHAAKAAADFAQSCKRTIHIDIAYDHVGSPQYGSSSSMMETRVSSELYQFLSTDRIRHLSQRHTQAFTNYDEFELVGLPNPKMMTYTNWNYSSALRFYGDHQIPNLQQLNLYKVKAINSHLMDLVESSPSLHRLECVEVDLDNDGNFPPSANPWRFVWETLNRHTTLQELSFSRLGVMGFSGSLIEDAGNDDTSAICLWSGQAEIETGLSYLIEMYYYLRSLQMVNVSDLADSTIEANDVSIRSIYAPQTILSNWFDRQRKEVDTLATISLCPSPRHNNTVLWGAALERRSIGKALRY